MRGSFRTLLTLAILSVCLVIVLPSGPAAAAAAPSLPSTVVGWGTGSQGQLGNGSQAGSATASAAVGAPSVAQTTDVSGEYDHACAVSGGRAYCWGRNDKGQLGNGTTTQSSSPVAVTVSGVLAGRTVTRIATGGFHTCAIADHKVFCWGYGFYGQLGTGAFGVNADSLVPVEVAALDGATSTEISAGYHRTCSLSDGLAYCWGDNAAGQTGQPHGVVQSPVPVAVAGFPSGAVLTHLTGGDQYSCLLAAAVPFCWGANDYGQLGSAVQQNENPVPVQVDVSGAIAQQAVSAIDAGEEHTCAIAGGKPFCWGSNGQGDLGNGLINVPSHVPVAVDTTGVLAGRVSSSVSAGNGSSCVVADGLGFCWGGATQNQIGDGLTNGPATRSRPAAVFNGDVLAGRPLISVSAGAGYVLAIAQPRNPATFEDVAPSRLLDTRTSLGGHFGPVPAGGTVAVQVTGRGGVPAAGVNAAWLTVTVLRSTSGGFLTVFPNGRTRPVSSNLNYTVGQTIANSVVVQVGADGKVAIYNGSPGTADVLIDVAGYWFTGVPKQAGSLGVVQSTRILDTRTGRSVSGGSAQLLTVDGVGGVPATTSTPVILNLTVVSPPTGGYLTVYCEGTRRPGVSNMNFGAGQTMANLVVTPACPTGRIAVYNGSTGAVNMIADVLGYFIAGTGSGKGTFTSVAPARLYDSRIAPHSSLSGGTAVDIAVSGRSSIPASGISSVLMTFTVTNTLQPGFITAFASGGARPNVSQLNFAAGGTIADLSLVPVGANGRTAVFNGSSGTVDLIADIVGYFRPN